MSYASRIGTFSRFVCPALFCLLSAGTAGAATTDRDYRLGDDPVENALVGQPVGQSSIVSNHTLDSASQGSFFDIAQTGNPTYVGTFSTGRPGAAAVEKGIQFTGSSSQYLQGAGFGSPREGGALANPPIPTYPDSRIMQIWVRPTLDTGARQDVVNDTFQFGIHITPGDTWGHTYGSQAGAGVNHDTGAPVPYNQWTHVMQRTFGADGVAVYVDGVAVDRINASYAQSTGAADDRNLYVGAAIGATGNHFTGVLDNLKIMVEGVFTPPPPQDPVNWGAFDFEAENEFVASRGLVRGDVNGDGVVNGDGSGNEADDDARFFVNRWMAERRVDNLMVGDLVSRTTLADLNYDGITNRDDWRILVNEHPGDLTEEDLDRLIPEPSGALLGGLGMLVLLARRRSRR